MITRPRAVLAFVLLSTLTLGCESGDQAGATSETMESDTAMEEAAAPDVASVRSAIEASNDDWEAAANAGDAAALTALYTDDATLLAPDMPAAHGSAEIRSAFDGMFEEVSIATEITTDDVHVTDSGDVAYVVGTYHDTGTLADGTSLDERGKYVAIYRNVGGEWKIAVDAWNSNGTASTE